MKLRKRIPLVATPSGGVGHAARRTNTTAAGRTEPALAATKVLCPPVQVSSGWTSGRSQSRQAVSESASVWEMAKRGRRSVGIELFLSTSPVWGTTYLVMMEIGSVLISIHVPRMGDDPQPPVPYARRAAFLSTSPVWGTTDRKRHGYTHALDFYPRPPYGGRRT